MAIWTEILRSDKGEQRDHILQSRGDEVSLQISARVAKFYLDEIFLQMFVWQHNK